MKYRLDEPTDEEKNAAQKYISETSAVFHRINQALELNPADPFYVSGGKLLLRLLFLLFCIALSPFVLIGLMMAVIVVA